MYALWSRSVDTEIYKSRPTGLRGCSSKHRKHQRIITCINCSCSNCCYSGFILHPKKTLSSWWPMPSNAILLLPQLPSHLSIAIAWASSSVGATLGPSDARCPSPRGGTAHVAQRQEHQLVNGLQFTSCPCTYQLYNRVHRMIDHLHLSCLLASATAKSSISTALKALSPMEMGGEDGGMDHMAGLPTWLSWESLRDKGPLTPFAFIIIYPCECHERVQDLEWGAKTWTAKVSPRASGFSSSKMSPVIR